MTRRMNIAIRCAVPVLLCLLGSASLVDAALNTSAPRGEKTVSIPVADKKPEICVEPKHFPGGDYSDKDAKTEAELCSYDTGTNTAVCPKENSTNPGLDFYSVPQGATPKSVADAKCKTTDAKKVAKYKLSTSCSYTPSILGYYHLSRILGGAAAVPPSVLRTYDLQQHIALARIALAQTAASSLIHQTWASLLAQLTAGANASKRDLLLTADFTQSYGALSDNPTKEAFYKEFFNGGANPATRAANFRDHNPTVQMLARSADVSTFVPRTFNVQNVQTMVQLKDASELIIMDTLMNQQDRFGNMHLLETYYYIDRTGGAPKLKTKKKLTPDEVTQLGAVQVKTLLLKDNDCGVVKSNVAKQAGLANKIAHVDPDTYHRLLRLDAAADSPDTKTFFQQELVFTNADYTSFRQNLKDLAGKLHQACTQGKLKLDLDLQAYFSGAPLQAQSCEVSGSNP
jgi:hypothetical protein